MTEESAPAPSLQRIHALEADVVNQIAAGEVVQRPASALKELLENAIDAGSSQINITVGGGGLKLLQVTDNGGGIHPADLPVLCYRHTTSKLRTYEELQDVGTLGFRGEALCSISFVSRLSVVSRRRGEDLGYKAVYRDSRIVEPGGEPCAAVQGTSITVEDMFYNTPTRRRAMGSGADEFRHVFEVVAQYAVFSTGVGITLKRTHQTSVDILTLPRFSRKDCIRAVFGSSIANHLTPLSVRLNWAESHTGGPADPAAPTPLPGAAATSGPSAGPEAASDRPPAPPAAPRAPRGGDEAPAFSVDGVVTTLAAAARRTTLVLFINGRPTACTPLKAALDAVYGAMHGKAACYFAFLDVRLPSRHVDVNVHPTKSEVAVLFQEELVEAVRQEAERALREAHGAQSFGVGGARDPPSTGARAASTAEGSQRKDQTDQVRRDHKLNRTDHRDRPLEHFVAAGAARPSATALKGSVARRGAIKQRRGGNILEKPLDPQQAAHIEHLESGVVAGRQTCSAPKVEAIQTLLDGVHTCSHSTLTRLVREHVFVGFASPATVLLQHTTKLYLVQLEPLSNDFFFQLLLESHGDAMEVMEVADTPPLSELVTIALESQQERGELTGEDGSVEELCDLVLQLLESKAEWLQQFGICMKAGKLVGLPRLLPGYQPDTDTLPELLLSLAGDVPWTDEGASFEATAKIVAHWYRTSSDRLQESAHTGAESQADAQAEGGATNDTKMNMEGSELHQLYQTVLLPAMRMRLYVPYQRATDRTVVHLASLERLYKIFERC